MPNLVMSIIFELFPNFFSKYIEDLKFRNVLYKRQFSITLAICPREVNRIGNSLFTMYVKEKILVAQQMNRKQISSKDSTYKPGDRQLIIVARSKIFIERFLIAKQATSSHGYKKKKIYTQRRPLKLALPSFFSRVFLNVEPYQLLRERMFASSFSSLLYDDHLGTV